MSRVGIIDMSKFKPGTVGKNSIVQFSSVPGFKFDMCVITTHLPSIYLYAIKYHLLLRKHEKIPVKQKDRGRMSKQFEFVKKSWSNKPIYFNFNFPWLLRFFLDL